MLGTYIICVFVMLYLDTTPSKYCANLKCRIITDDLSKIQHAENIVLLCTAAVEIPLFLGWINWRERRGKPVLISNSLWRNTGFTTICVMIFLSWAVMNGIETLMSLLCVYIPASHIEVANCYSSFQEVQKLSPIQAAIRFIPNVVAGSVLNLGTGLMVHRLKANHLVLVTTILSAGSPLLMAIIGPRWSWWYCAFWAMLLSPLSADGNSSSPPSSVLVLISS